MRRFMIAAFLTALLGACSGDKPADKTHDGETNTPEVPEISYQFTANFSSRPITLDIAARFAGDEDGETEIRIGGRWANENQAYKRFRNLTVLGEDVILPDDMSGRRIFVKHAPDAPLTVTYTLSADDMRDAATDIEYFYAPVLQTDVLHLIGTTSLAVPAPDDEMTRFKVISSWSGLPDGWETVNTLPDKAIHPVEIRQQIFAAAPAAQISSAGGNQGMIILNTGQHDFSADAFNVRITGVFDGLNRLWGADTPKYLVTFLGTPPHTDSGSITGTGRYNSFAMAATPGVELEFLSRFLVHEVAHHWMPGQLGSWTQCKSGEICPPKTSWFTEGFTDFVMSRAMLADGSWTQKDLADFTNTYLRNYYLSPAKNAEAQTIDERFWSDFEHERQPYWRGFLIAMNWNAQIETATDGQSSVMTVLREMYETARALPQNEKPVLTAQFLAAKFSEKAGRDVYTDIETFYHKGETLNLDPMLFEGCAVLDSLPAYQYDVSFDAGATLGSGVVSGVVPGSNADKAGLRNGQTFVSKDSGGGGDTAAPLVMTVKENGKNLQISYIPISGDAAKIPQFEISPECSN